MEPSELLWKLPQQFAPCRSVFFLSKTYCVSFKEWKSLQSIFRDVNQRLVRAETKYKGSECCFCVSYLITRS